MINGDIFNQIIQYIRIIMSHIYVYLNLDYININFNVKYQKKY